MAVIKIMILSPDLLLERSRSRLAVDMAETKDSMVDTVEIREDMVEIRASMAATEVTREDMVEMEDSTMATLETEVTTIRATTTITTKASIFWIL